MFKKSKTIIAFQDRKLIASRVVLRKSGFVVEEEIEKTFTAKTLVEILEEVKQQMKIEAVRVLLPEEKVYLKLLEIPRKIGVTRDLVLKKAQEAIPEVLQDGYFDWKQVGVTKNDIKIQVLAVSEDYLFSIQKAAEEVGLKIEAFESPSYALARITAGQKSPHLIVFPGIKTILCAAHQGAVFESLVIDGNVKIEEKTKELISLVKDKWGVVIKKIIKDNLDPIIGLALKADIKGQDEKVLNLTPPETKDKLEIGEKMTEQKEKKEGEGGKPAKLEVVEVQNQEGDLSLDGGTASESPDKEEVKQELRTLPDEDENEGVSETALGEDSDQDEEDDSETVESGTNERGVIGKIFNKRNLLIALVVILGLGVIGGGIFVYKKAMNGGKSTDLKEVAGSPLGKELSKEQKPADELPTETPTPTPELNREDLKIQILNGSGVTGTAGKAQEFLEGLGYKEIETGNADSYDYEKAEISIKEKKKAYLDLLIEDLSEKYAVSSETKTLDEDSDYDAVVVVGKE